MAIRQTADMQQRDAWAAPSGQAEPPPGCASSLASASTADCATNERHICIAVDDFGLHDGVNQAALRLAAMSRVQAIGCMVGGAAWAHGSPLLRRLRPQDTDLGLHLDLTDCALLPGAARPLAGLIRDAFLRRLDRRAVRAEIRAQLDAFEQSLARQPAYVDGHQHVHQLPIVRTELIDELDHRYGWHRPWLRCTRRPRGPRGVGAQGVPSRLKPVVIEGLGCSGLMALARRSGYEHNAHLLGVYDFRGGQARYERLLAAWLQAARDGDLLMCHPSLPVDAADPIIASRCAEFEVLSGAAFEARVVAAGIVLQPLSRILQARPQGVP